jgi:restriction system protein
MAVPDYQAMMLPVLMLFANGARNVSECVPSLKSQFNLTEEEATELIPSGRISILGNRAHWARTYLAKAGLLESPKRNLHVITESGRRFLETNPDRIDNKVLATFEGFEEWRRASLASGDTQGAEPTLPNPTVVLVKDNQQTPEDAMASAQAMLDAALRDDILLILKDINPVRFERLILDLLSAMGYGGGDLSNAFMTKATGDGGIDGIIHEDALGLDAVYIQAKRYAPEIKVSSPDIQQFIGSLSSQGATKGVFVTTSDFSAPARGILGKVQHRIVLINGQELARLMIRYGVGVRARTTYVIKGVDEDYFADLNAG